MCPRLSVSLMFLVANCVSQRTNTLEMDEMRVGCKDSFSLVFLQQRLLPLSVCQVSVILGEFAIFSSWRIRRESFDFRMAVWGSLFPQSLDYGQWLESSSVINQMNCLLLREGKQNFRSSIAEVVPASLILLPLLFIGLWPKGISRN